MSQDDANSESTPGSHRESAHALQLFGSHAQFSSVGCSLREAVDLLRHRLRAREGTLWVPRDSVVDSGEIAQQQPLQMAYTTFGREAIATPGVSSSGEKRIAQSITNEVSRTRFAYKHKVSLYYDSLGECAPSNVFEMEDSNLSDRDWSEVNSPLACFQPDRLAASGLDATWCIRIPISIRCRPVYSDHKEVAELFPSLFSSSEVSAADSLVLTLDGQREEMATAIDQDTGRWISLAGSHIDRAIWMESDFLQEMAIQSSELMRHDRDKALTDYVLACSRFLEFEAASLFARIQGEESLELIGTTGVHTDLHHNRIVVPLSGKGPAATAAASHKTCVAEAAADEQWSEYPAADEIVRPNCPNQVIAAPIGSSFNRSRDELLGVIKFHNRSLPGSSQSDLSYYPINAIDRFRIERLTQSCSLLLQIERELDAKEQILSVVRHDYRMPAANIRTFAARYASKEPRDLRARVDELRSRLNEIVDVTSDMIFVSDIARLGLDSRSADLSKMLKPRPILLGDVLRTVVRYYENASRELGLTRYGRAGLQYDTLPRDLRILADPRAIRAVLYNLLDNALKYTFDDGDRRESMSLVSIFGVRGEIDRQPSSSGFSLVIENWGVGVDDDEVDLIFASRYRGRGARRSEVVGAGMGLGTARRLAEAQGSRLVLVSPSMPTQFALVFPPELVQGTFDDE